MKNYLTKLFNDSVAKWTMARAKKMVESFAITVEKTDIETGTLTMALSNEISIVLVVDKSITGNRLETTLTILPATVSLKTMSDLAGIAFIHNCSISGLRPTDDKKVNFSICCGLNGDLTRHSLAVAITYIGKCIQSIDDCLFGRQEKLEITTWNLEAFEDIELYLFNPQLLGERKDFIYKTWDAYYDAVMTGTTVSAGADERMDETPQDILACKAFEEQTGLKLAEVGDLLLCELVWCKRMAENAEEEGILH